MTSFDLTLYLVTDRRMPKEGFETVVEEAIRGGVTLVQLREKEGDTGLLYERARRLKEVTDRYHIPLIIDDRIDIMLAVDAAGQNIFVSVYKWGPGSGPTSATVLHLCKTGAS